MNQFLLEKMISRKLIVIKKDNSNPIVKYLLKMSNGDKKILKDPWFISRLSHHYSSYL